MLQREEQRSMLLPHRDAVLTSLQFGLGARNQEVFALRWGNVHTETIEILEALAWGALDEGKTYSSTPRMTTMPSTLREDLDAWKRVLKQHGRSTRPEDFIISGDLAGARYGVPDPRTGACHFTRNQSQKWNAKYFRPAVEAVAKSVKGMDGIAGATEYALRRGCITARLRAEDPQIVAGECGTSLVMLDRHYSFALAEHRREPGRPLDIVWREAREKVTGKPPRKRRLHAVA
jgi:integrase